MVAFQLYKVFPFFLFLSQQKRGSLYKNHTVQWPTFCSTYLVQGNVWENCGIVFGQYSIGTSCCLCQADQHRQFSPPAAQNHPSAKPQWSHICTAHTNTHTPHNISRGRCAFSNRKHWKHYETCILHDCALWNYSAKLLISAHLIFVIWTQRLKKH